VRGGKHLKVPTDKEITAVTYSIAGLLGYVDSGRHADNFRRLADAKNVRHVIIRLRGLLAADYEGQEMLAEAVADMEAKGKVVYVSSASEHIMAELKELPLLFSLRDQKRFTDKTEDALKTIGLL